MPPALARVQPRPGQPGNTCTGRSTRITPPGGVLAPRGSAAQLYSLQTLRQDTVDASRQQVCGASKKVRQWP